MALKKSPNTFGTSNGFKIKEADIAWIAWEGAPDATVGVGVCGKGSMCSDVINGKLYMNVGTKAVPSWKLVTQAA